MLILAALQGATFRVRTQIALCRALCLMACLLVPACAHLGQRVEQTPLPPGAPQIDDVLNALAANDAAIRNFKATGTFTLSSPDLAAVERSRDGAIYFRRPADLCVIGRGPLRTVVFRLTCVGSEFLIEFPATPTEEPYYRLEGERFSSVPFSVSPVDIAREMFLPETWSGLRKSEVRMTSYDPAAQTATIEIGPKRAPRRRGVLSGGKTWLVTRSERLNEKGEPIAVTTRGDYREIEGVYFAASLDANFPLEETRMTFEMRTIVPNTELKDELFDIKARAHEVGVDRERPPSQSHERRPRRK